MAGLIWADALPPTWPTALRGVVRGLRTALAPIGGAGQSVIETVPSGYRLAPGVEVDLRIATATLRLLESHAAADRHRAVLDAGEALTRLGPDRLLAGEDGGWLDLHRAALSALALRAAELVVTAAGQLREHHEAVDVARRTLRAQPLDERAHRLLITALDRAGDRAGAARAYETCRATLADELGVDPSAETVYLAAIRAGESVVRARIPIAVSSFVGRDTESERLAAIVARPGLVTVTGRGGVGKSRLAQHVASALDLPGGRSWVSLVAVADDELVAASVVLQLGVDVGAGVAVEQLTKRLAPAGRALLVLDGCEAVTDGVASLAAALLASCPALTVLVTSRVRIGLDGEQWLDLAPLPIPDAVDVAGFEANPQVQILVDRVRAEGGELTLDGQHRPDRRAVPALRRPAARARARGRAARGEPVGDLFDQLEQVEAVPEDQLRTMARSSYAMLTGEEAAVFRRLGVLDGAVGLPLVRAVVTGTDVVAVRVVRIMRELSARGLVTVDRSGPRWRYQQDDDLHRYARELLDAEGQERAGFDRLAHAVRTLLPDDAAPPASFADEVSAVLDSLRSLFGAGLDGRADLDRCLELAFRLHRYWTATTVAEGRFWLSRLLAACPPESPWRRYATYALGYLSYWSADIDDALRDLQAAIAMFGDEPDPFVARAYIYVAGLLDDQDRSAEALHFVHRAIAAAEPFGTDLYVAAAMGIGSVLSERGDPAAARYAADAVERCRLDGSADQLSVLLPTAAMVCWPGAAALTLVAVDTATAMSIGFPLAICLETAALVGARAGASPAELAGLLAAADELRAIGDRPGPRSLRPDVDALRADVGAAAVPADPAGLARRVLQTVTAATP